MIAFALALNTPITLLDEPTNGLDPNQIVEIRELIKEIGKDRSVLLSTHILPEVQVTCNYIKMIENGQLVFSGTSEQFNNYLEPERFTVTLLNPPPAEELHAIPGVIEIESNQEGHYRIRFAGNKNITKEVVELSVARNWELTEIALEKSSLDEVFSFLSKQSQQSTEA